jgi:hypothetical protein
MNYYCPGGVAQRTLHLPQKQKTRVRIPPGYTDFREDSNAFVYSTQRILLPIFVLEFIFVSGL